MRLEFVGGVCLGFKGIMYQIRGPGILAKYVSDSRGICLGFVGDASYSWACYRFTGMS
ncbi:hypothetical protein QJS04_geneDACA017930 [Acorus gramineus]|uniref:Uncharacterized protein n=1 Tax=Acorus gramineus TaxID=55184 RepID=A0AAV9BZJ9_ACOGR|nr:hypothetical protein QJS04_geneDACA017930 [Acorus gramineus]